jgi:hypothetical protein
LSRGVLLPVVRGGTGGGRTASLRSEGKPSSAPGQRTDFRRSAENGDTEILRVDDGGFKKIYDCNVFESCGPVRFHKDGRRVYLMTNKGSNLIRLTLLDVDSGKEELVEADPHNRVDLANRCSPRRPTS